MTDNEIKKCLEIYERQLVQKYDSAEYEKIELPSDLKKNTLDKVLCQRSDKKWMKNKRVLKTLTAAVLICALLVALFASSDISADILGFDAWKMTYLKKDKSGNSTIDYNKNKHSKENGGDEMMKRISNVPQYVPEGFKDESGNLDFEVGPSKEWSNGKKLIYFSTNKIMDDDDVVYYGKNIKGKKVSVAGYIGYIYEIEKGNRKLQWNDDEYINSILTDADIDDSELLKMAESMYEKKK